MKDRNFTVALLPNSFQMMSTLAGQRGFLALADAEDSLNCVVLFPPGATEEDTTENVNTARLLAAAPQMFRALKEIADLVRYSETRDEKAEDWVTTFDYLSEYIAGKMGNQTEGGIVDLPKFF